VVLFHQCGWNYVMLFCSIGEPVLEWFYSLPWVFDVVVHRCCLWHMCSIGVAYSYRYTLLLFVCLRWLMHK